MTKEYTITGMTCGGCLANVSDAIKKIDGVKDALVQLEHPQAKVVSEGPIDLKLANEALGKVGGYTIRAAAGASPQIREDRVDSTLKVYKPLILIIAFITIVCALSQYPFTDFSFMRWMRHFMAGFFIVFSFFKLLNLKGFVHSYRMYDIVAAKWRVWAYLYPFIELGLGLLYLMNLVPFATNIATIVVLGVSSIGVIRSNLSRRKIHCACLGDVFHLPMSTVTIVEDVSMVVMAALMLLFV